MIIQCENCDTKYNISEAAIGPSGRFVRCTHCAHEWVAYVPVPEVVPTSANRTAYYNHAAKGEGKGSLLLYCSMLFALIGLSVNIILGGMLMMDHMGMHVPFYKAVKPYYYYDLKISDVSVKIQPSKLPQMQEVGLDMVIHNVGRQVEYLSNIRITAFDKNRKRIAELKASNSYGVNPGQQQMVHSWIKDVPVATRYISLEFGGCIEFVIRPASALIEKRMI